jgi:hypothetical protein
MRLRCHRCFNQLQPWTVGTLGLTTGIPPGIRIFVSVWLSKGVSILWSFFYSKNSNSRLYLCWKAQICIQATRWNRRGGRKGRKREKTKNGVNLSCEMMIMNFIIPYLNIVILQIERDICYFLIWFKNWALLRHNGVKRFNRIGYHSEEIVMRFVNHGHTSCDTVQSYDFHQRFGGTATLFFTMKLHSYSTLKMEAPVRYILIGLPWLQDRLLYVSLVISSVCCS